MNTYIYMYIHIIFGFTSLEVLEIADIWGFPATFLTTDHPIIRWESDGKVSKPIACVVCAAECRLVSSVAMLRGLKKWRYSEDVRVGMVT